MNFKLWLQAKHDPEFFISSISNDVLEYPELVQFLGFVENKTLALQEIKNYLLSDNSNVVIFAFEALLFLAAKNDLQLPIYFANIFCSYLKCKNDIIRNNAIYCLEFFVFGDY